jgi:type I restriction enzyme, S subunit
MQKHSTNIRNLQLAQYKSVDVPLPSLSDQKRIVAILDEAFAGIETAIANTEKNLANALQLFESDLEAMVRHGARAGGVVALADLATDITDGDHMPPPKSVDGLPFITIKNIEKKSRIIDFEDTFKVPEEYYDSLKPNRKPILGDVLYTVTGSYGIPVRVHSDRRFCFQRHIGLIRPKSMICSKWLEYMLLSKFVKDQADAGATGTAQKTVSLRLLRSMKVPNQGAGEQSKTVSRLDFLGSETQRLSSLYEQRLHALRELKKSLLQKAFSGELTAEREIQTASA